MKLLKDYEKELNKCSRCGQCQIVCPIYKLTKNDCTVSRGKFLMLLGVIQNKLKLSKNINKYLDMCLKCGKCSEYCPAGIDVIPIFNCAKAEYMKKTFLGKIIKLFQNQYVFSNIINAGKFLYRIIKPCSKAGTHVHNKSRAKLIYFKGCVNNISAKTDEYISNIFAGSDLEILSPEFDCCGLPFLSEGNIERFEQAAKKNIEKLDTNYSYLVTDCASCEDTILNYHKYIDCNIDDKKTLNWGEIIALENIKFEYPKPLKITFHKPCHLKNDTFFEKIISNCSNIEYVKMNNYDECCGLAGSFGIKNRNLSKELSKNKAINIQNTNADYVITSCPACVIGLKQGLKLIGNKKVKVVSLLEFLSMGKQN